MEGPPLGPGGEDITWPDQVAPRGRKASSTRKINPQTSNLKLFMSFRSTSRFQVVIFCSRSSFSWEISPMDPCFNGHERRVGLA